MRLTEEEYMALVPFEKHMETALRAGWSRNPGLSALDTMHAPAVLVARRSAVHSLI